MLALVACTFQPRSGFAAEVGAAKQQDSLRATPSPADTFEKYNVLWESQSQNSAESMPLSGGEIGANVWVENGDLLFYAQQSGAFDKNGEFNKMGRFRITLRPNPFSSGGTFRQELQLKTGRIQIRASTPTTGDVAVNLWIEVKRPVLHVQVEAARPIAMTAAYESWRFQDVVLHSESRPPHEGRRSSLFDYDGYQRDVVKKGDVVLADSNRVTWYQDNGTDFDAVDFALKIQQLEAIKGKIWDPLRHLVSGGMMRGDNLEFVGRSDGIYFQTPFRAWQFRSRQPARTHHLEIFGQIENAPAIADWKNNLQAVADQKTDMAKLWSSNVDWWDNFWNRSYVVINSGRDQGDVGWRVGRNYNLFRYQLGGNYYGKVPTKFNGGNLTFDAGHVDKDYPYDPDYRRWGGWSYTSANQRLVYWPFLKNGDFEAMLSEFDVYRNGLGNAEARTREIFGHAGCSFAEQFQLSGLPVTAMYGFVEHGYSWRIRPANLEGRELANPAISTFYQGQLEHAFMILEYFRFSGRDISAYIPFIISSVRFYDEHYQLSHRQWSGQPLDARGKLVIFPSTPGENHLNATNPADAVAGLWAVTEALEALPGSLLSAEQREYITGFRQRIPDLPTYRKVIDGQERTFLAVAENDQAMGGGFYPNLHSVFPYNLLYTGGAGFERAADTWSYMISPANKQAYVGHRPSVIYSALLGLTDEAKFTLSKKMDDRSGNNSRFPTFVGPGFDWSPDQNWLGGGMIGLQEMLLQTPGREIRVLPAWPKEWDVSFKLHAPYGTTVEVVFQKGVITMLRVTPQSREKDVVVQVAQRGSEKPGPHDR